MEIFYFCYSEKPEFQKLAIEKNAKEKTKNEEFSYAIELKNFPS